jgi:hypothetical protein
MTASNQNFLVMDVRTPVAAFTARASCNVLGQPRPINLDHVGGAGRMIEAKEMGVRAPGVVMTSKRPRRSQPPNGGR